MAYTKKLIPDKRPDQTWQQYVLMLIDYSPKGYFRFIDRLPEVTQQVDELPYPTRNERLYNWLYPDCVSACIVCGDPTKFNSLVNGGYRQFCSCSCKATHHESHKNGLTPTAIDKRRRWRSELTDDDYRLSNAKRKQTTIDRHGPDLWKRANAAAVATHAEARPDQLNDQQWLHDQYFDKKNTISQVAYDLGVGWNMVAGAVERFSIPRHYSGTRCSVAEQQLAAAIAEMGVDIVQHDRSIIGPHELDIVIPSKQLAIEYCGLYWHSSANPRMTVNYHNEKRLKCQAAGITLITVFEDEWLTSPDIVLNRLRHACGANTKSVYARRTTVVPIDAPTARQFFASYHIQGNKGAPIRFGLRDASGTIVAIMTFGKSRYDKSADFEMIRYATIPGTSVVGGASKLFCYFIKQHPDASVVSYSDNRWGTGTVYERLGFDRVGCTTPSYYYFKGGTTQRFHRSRFMKHVTVEMGGDPAKTEIENMHDLGYFRIYDCGTTKWRYK